MQRLSQESRLMSPSQEGRGALVEALILAAQNERLAPDVLAYPADALDSALAAIATAKSRIAVMQAAHQERLRRRQEGLDEDIGGGASLQLPFQPHDILALETSRIEFAVAELLRVRLQKIQVLCHRIHYRREQYRVLLSHKELIVAEKLCELYEQAIATSGLHSAFSTLATNDSTADRALSASDVARRFLLPQPDGYDPLPVPNKRSRVFVCALEDLGQIEVGPSSGTTVQAGDTLMAPFEMFETAINRRQVRLL